MHLIYDHMYVILHVQCMYVYIANNIQQEKLPTTYNKKSCMHFALDIFQVFTLLYKDFPIEIYMSETSEELC